MKKYLTFIDMFAGIGGFRSGNILYAGTYNLTHIDMFDKDWKELK